MGEKRAKRRKDEALLASVMQALDHFSFSGHQHNSRARCTCHLILRGSSGTPVRVTTFCEGINDVAIQCDETVLKQRH